MINPLNLIKRVPKIELVGLMIGYLAILMIGYLAIFKFIFIFFRLIFSRSGFGENLWVEV